MQFKKIFKNKKVLEEMIELRKDGWSLKTLGIRYGVNQTSIRYWCMKAGLPNKMEISMVLGEFPIDEGGTEERVNRGKSYMEYVAEARRHHPFEYRYLETNNF